MSLQEFFANVVQKPCPKFVLFGNNKNMNHNNNKIEKSFLREGKNLIP